MNGFQGVKQITHQMVDLLEQISDKAYCQPLDLYDGSSIGKHFRHIFDFYRCLSLGLEEQAIDYSKRERNQILEENPKETARQFLEVIQSFEDQSSARSLQVLCDFSSDNSAQREYSNSTLGRELAFIYDHAVHHLAIIKIGLKLTTPELDPGRGFGVAPSTLKYEQQN